MSDMENKGLEIKETAEGAETAQENAVKEAAPSDNSAPTDASASSDKNEIKETTGNDVEIYDEDDSVDLSDSPKKKKRFKKRYVAIPLLALAAAGGIFGFINSKKTPAVVVETEQVALGTIENILSISGTVESAETKSYFATVNAKIDTLDVKVGDKVKSGEVLYTFDTEALDLAQKQAELAIKQAKGSYSALYSKSPTITEDLRYAEGMDAQQIQDRLDQIEKQIDSINIMITEKKSRMNQTLTDLQKTAMDINQNGIQDGTAESIIDGGSNSYITRRENEQIDKVSESNRQMALAVQQSIQDVQYALNNDPEIKDWNNQITTLKEEQAHLNSAKSAMGTTYVNPGTAQSTKAQMESQQLAQEDTIEKIEEAKEGVKAEFNGVITAIPQTVMEGATVQAGTQLMTVANLDDVQVSIQVSKSDLPKISVGEKVDITINGKQYNGEITKISGTATKNSNGVAMVATLIKVTNPDSDIILGVEANNKIHAQKAENTIVLPYEHVLTDATGDYVYVVENGLVTRKDVVVGISNSTEAQITQGLEVGDEVITSDASALIEGSPVTVQ